jgi:hypothetical protein
VLQLSKAETEALASKDPKLKETLASRAAELLDVILGG